MSYETKLKNDFAVDSRDINLHYLYSNYMEDPTVENAELLQKELKERQQVDRLFETLFPKHVEDVKNNNVPLPTDFECYRTLRVTMEESCGFTFNDYSLKHMKYLVAECEGLKSVQNAFNETQDRIIESCTIRQ